MRALGLGTLALLLAIAPVARTFAVDIPQDVLNERDPFKMPELPKGEPVKSDLELFPVDQFKLVGVLSGGRELRAMIAAPNGKTYFVKVNMVIGTKKGFIRRITESALYIREKGVNVLGDPENDDTVLQLPTEGKQDVKMTTSEHGW